MGHSFYASLEEFCFHSQKGALDVGADENPNPLDKHVLGMAKCTGGPPDAPIAPWLFAHAGREHSKR